MHYSPVSDENIYSQMKKHNFFISPLDILINHLISRLVENANNIQNE